MSADRDELALLTVAEAADLLRVRDDFVTAELVAGRLKGFPWPQPRPGDPPRLRRSWRVPRWAIRDWQAGLTEAAG